MIKYVTAITVALLAVSSFSQAAERKVIIGLKEQAKLTEEAKDLMIKNHGGRIKRSHKLINAVSAQLPEEELEKLKNDPAIAYVEADSVVGIDPVVNVPLTQEYADSWGVTKIGGQAAVAAGITGSGIKVAILDSGIDYSHPDLKDNYKGGYNFAYGNNDPFDDGYNSHGTHIAGIIGARNNGTGVVGVAPEVSLYAVKVLGGMVMGELSDILAGMEWAISNRMDIINLSIGAPIDSIAFKDASDRAFAAGIVVVAASGNSHSSVVEYPAAYDSVIAVSATDQNDLPASFSNYGPKIELAAPGVAIRSTVRGGGYGLLSGTSQATAQVSGAAAILLAQKIAGGNNTGQGKDIRTLLDATALDLGEPGRDQYYGFGRVDLAKAFAPPAPTRWTYTITRKAGSPESQVLDVPLKPGKYQVQITLDGHLELKIVANDGNGSRRIKYPEPSTAAKPDNDLPPLDITVGASGSLSFIPEGKPGSSADIVITKTSSN